MGVSNREKATLIWLGIVLVAGLANAEIRRSLWEVVKAFANPKIVVALLVFGGWTVGLAAGLHAIGLWEQQERHDTAVWFATAGVAFFASLTKVTQDGFVRATLRRTVGATVFVEGFANLAVFPLALELALLPLLVLVSGTLAVSETKEEYAPARRVLNGLLTAIGFCVLIYVAVRLAGDFDAAHTVRALALPVWLTVGSLPLVYVLGVIAEYELAFIRINLRTDEPSRRHRAKRALVRAARLSASELEGFAGHWIPDLVGVDSSDEARALMRRWRTMWRDERRTSRMTDARASMRTWLTEADPTLVEMHAGWLRRAWERLDGEQRAALKSEGLKLSPRGLADDVRALPD